MNSHPARKILLVEDYKAQARVTRHELESGGYAVTVVSTGEEALIEIHRQQFELIVLDVGLPGISGFDVLQQIRIESYAIPVLILSAQEEIDDRVKGLKLGADDYLVKPYDARELIARVETILHRSGNHRVSILQFDDLVLDLVKRKMFRNDHEIPLTSTEFSLMAYFLRHPTEIITRQKLTEEVWGMTFDPGTNIVDVTISRLRKSINEGFERKYISTVHGEGFILSIIMKA